MHQTKKVKRLNNCMHTHQDGNHSPQLHHVTTQTQKSPWVQLTYTLPQHAPKVTLIFSDYPTMLPSPPPTTHLKTPLPTKACPPKSHSTLWPPPPHIPPPKDTSIYQSMLPKSHSYIVTYPSIPPTPQSQVRTPVSTKACSQSPIHTLWPTLAYPPPHPQEQQKN